MGSIRLSKPDRVKYSPLEEEIFNLLPRSGKRLDTNQLANKVYGGDVPINGRLIVTGTLRKLIKKSLHNKEAFKIKTSERRGPYPLEVWLELPTKTRGLSTST
jgi:hypothetical protein